MKKTRVLWMLMLVSMMSFSVVSCTSRDENDDNLTYSIRDYIIGIGKWNTDRVKKADGTWSDFPFGEGKAFTIEFFDKKDGSGQRIFKSWENINQTDPKANAVEYEGAYIVSGQTVVCYVNGQQHLTMFVTSTQNRELAATVTFHKHNMTFETVMTRSW